MLQISCLVFTRYLCEERPSYLFSAFVIFLPAYSRSFAFQERKPFASLWTIRFLVRRLLNNCHPVAGIEHTLPGGLCRLL